MCDINDAQAMHKFKLEFTIISHRKTNQAQALDCNFKGFIRVLVVISCTSGAMLCTPASLRDDFELLRGVFDPRVFASFHCVLSLVGFHACFALLRHVALTNQPALRLTHI